MSADGSISRGEPPRDSASFGRDVGGEGPDPGSGFNLSAWAIAHGNFAAFLIVLLLAAGTFAFFTLGRKEDPDFTFRVMVVQVLWPGASVEEMQEQVVDKIERKLQETPGLEYLRSYTRPGSAAIFVNLKGDVRGAAVADAFYQVRKKIGDIRQTLPEGVIGPFFNDEFGDTYMSLYALTGQGYSYPEIKTFAKNARDIILRIPGVAKVDLLGTQEERVFIEVSSAALAERGLSALDIQAALDGQNAMDPAGRIETNERSVRIDVEGGLKSVADIRELRLRAGQQTFRLGDIAEVKRALEDPPVARTRYQGQEAVLLGATMAPGYNVTVVGAAVERALHEIERELPVGVQLGKISDQAQVVSASVGQFLRSLAEAIGIVLVVSFITLGVRAGLVVALTIPLVLAATFFVMQAMGIDLQRISLGALIIALGLLVDDAMIAVEMMDRKLQEGYDRLRAATFAYTSTAFPMLTGTLITVAGFIPVGFAASQAGEYVSALFWVTGISLVISWFAAVYFTPWIGYRLLKPRRRGATGHAEVFNSLPFRIIRAIVSWCVRWRKTVVVLTVGALAASIASFAIIPQQFFPTSNRPEILVDLWLPEGSSFADTEREAKAVEQRLLQDPDLSYVVAFVGEGAPRFYLPLDQQLKNQNFAQLMLMSKSLEAREHALVRVREILAQDFPNIRARAERLFNGPPVGWAVQVRVTGPDRAEVRRLADEIAGVMRASPEIGNVHNDWLEPVPSMKLEIDQDRSRALGVTSQAVRRSLQGSLSGFQIGEFREADETIKVMLREPSQTRNLLTALDNVYVKTAAGGSVPLRQVATVKLVLEPGIQWRRDRLPSITVRGTIPDNLQSNDVSNAVFAKLGSLRASLPTGYRMELQGAVEEAEKSQTSINEKMPIMLMVILVLLMIQLQHFGKTMMVLATGPLGIIGAAAALLLFQAAFGFVAILGVIALAGIVMRNSVILVDQIEQDMKAGSDPFTAIVESAVRRFRPITLTAAAAGLAMIPLAEEVFWAPMAISMMGGLVAATILTLTFLPALYALAFRVPRRADARSSEEPATDPRRVLATAA
ncbi:MAG TPA: efflux RND transporter permease subunit [Hyphomicrobiaceae bacterium]|jgi:multidrug efflux pump subunit AcrB|nr:efflux RND transporter permease subunit [Hyphomicrobiaceae bacterium]